MPQIDSVHAFSPALLNEASMSYMFAPTEISRLRPEICRMLPRTLLSGSS
jgi:hypothetical protein